MKKMLYILNVANRVNNFSYTAMKAAQKLGYDFYIAGNWSYANDQERIDDEKKYGIHIYQIDFVRTPYHPGNIRAYKQLKEIIEKGSFDVIHCNTPIGGVAGRLAGRKCGVATVIYQAHGFHFYKGAPLINWLLYYPIECWLAHYTDAIITINQEDFILAKCKLHLRNNGKVYYVPGVGIDTSQFEPRNRVRDKKRAELGLKNNEIMIVSAGDLIERKNYKTAIEAIAIAENSNLQYFICGKGIQEEKLKKLVKEKKLNSQVHFLGYRADIKELFQAADIFLLTSLQEGLARSMMEAMASGLPCVASKIRGNNDLLTSECGFLVGPRDSDNFAHSINKLAGDTELRSSMGFACKNRMQDFNTGSAEAAIEIIYKNEVGG